MRVFVVAYDSRGPGPADPATGDLELMPWIA
jgi:hypothetical protein